MTRTSTNYRFDVPPAELAHTRRVKLARKIVDAALTAAFVAFAVAVWVYYLTEPGQ